MKFTKIRLNGASTIELPLEGVGPLSPYVLKAADGLGPPQLNVVMGQPLDGRGYFQRRGSMPREIVLRIGLQPEWNIGQTPEELRTDLYSLITTKFNRLLGIEIVNGTTPVAVAQGHVKNFEIAPFSKDPEVQITILCDESYLLAPLNMAVTPARSVNGSVSSFVINNPGTAPTGFSFAIQTKAASTGVIRISDEVAGGQSLGANQNMAIDDVLVFSTASGSRSMFHKPAASSGYTNILGSIEAGSEWLQLHGGDNVLRINHPNFVWFSTGFVYRPAYWGV